MKNNCKEKLSKPGKVSYILSFLFFTADFVLFTLVGFLVHNYDGLSIEEMLFHIKVPLRGTSNNLFYDYLKQYYLYWIVYVLFIVTVFCIFFIWKKIKNCKWIYRFFLGMSVLGAAVNIILFVKHFEVASYIKKQLTASVFIEEHYIDPASVTLTYPKKREI